VISWPLGFVMLELGKGKWYLVTETAAHLGHLALIALGLAIFGLTGVAMAFFILYVGYTLVVWAVARHLTAFHWTADCLRLGALGLLILAGTFMATQILALWPATLVGALVTALVGVYSLRGLLRRVGTEHRVTQAVCKVPIIKVLCSH
jgi:O-antigen/teichoic acid export membrane protein